MAAVEGTPEAAAALGLSFSIDSDDTDADIVLFRDFVPYTERQTNEIVEQLLSIGASGLCEESELRLLKASYEFYNRDNPNTVSIEARAGCS